MNRQPVRKQNSSRQHRRVVRSDRARSAFGRGSQAKSNHDLSAKARSARQPLLVGEDALKKLHLGRPGSPSRRRRYVFRQPSGVTAVVGILLLSVLAFAVWHNGRFGANGGQPASADAASTDGLAPTLGLPSEKLPARDHNNNNGVKVAFDQPNLLVIDKLNVSAQIRSLGAGEIGQLMFPGNIYDIGWFNKSSLPGGNDSILLDAYANGPTKKGTLYDGNQLNPGDKLTIVRGDGVKFIYKFTFSRVYKNQANGTKDLLKEHYGSKQNLVLAVSQAVGGFGGSQSKQWYVIFAELQ